MGCGLVIALFIRRAEIIVNLRIIEVEQPARLRIVKASSFSRLDLQRGQMRIDLRRIGAISSSFIVLIASIFRAAPHKAPNPIQGQADSISASATSGTGPPPVMLTLLPMISPMSRCLVLRSHGQYFLVGGNGLLGLTQISNPGVDSA